MMNLPKLHFGQFGTSPNSSGLDHNATLQLDLKCMYGSVTIACATGRSRHSDFSQTFANLETPDCTQHASASCPSAIVKVAHRNNMIHGIRFPGSDAALAMAT